MYSADLHSPAEAQSGTTNAPHDGDTYHITTSDATPTTLSVANTCGNRATRRRLQTEAGDTEISRVDAGKRKGIYLSKLLDLRRASVKLWQFRADAVAFCAAPISATLL